MLELHPPSKTDFKDGAKTISSSPAELKLGFLGSGELRPALLARDTGVCAPFHFLQCMPIVGSAALCPILFIQDEFGSVNVHLPALRWARARLPVERGRGLRNDLAILGRLHDFHQVVWFGGRIAPADARTFIWTYLDARYHGSGSSAHLQPLGWQPVSFATVRSEFRSIVRFYNFLATAPDWAEGGFDSREALSGFAQRLRTESADPTPRFLGHLATSRARWDQLHGTGYRMPDLQVHEPRRSSASFSLDRTIDLEEALLIIRHEKNPFYRAIWLLGAFGGPRISEMLHMWQCDVLPPSTAHHVAGRQQQTPFVLIAHPAESKYLGDFTRVKETRLQHLSSRYGLVPRNHLQGYRRVGWKHPLMTDSKLNISEVFWCDNDQAAAFAETMAEIRHFHTDNRTGERHPYLFVNTNRGEGFEEPIAYSKARSAFGRACARVGLEPFVNGRRIHGLRHVYKLQLKRLKLAREHIQVAMRHNSIESQEDYGRTAREVREFLENRLKWGVPQ